MTSSLICQIWHAKFEPRLSGKDSLQTLPTEQFLKHRNTLTSLISHYKSLAISNASIKGQKVSRKVINRTRIKPRSPATLLSLAASFSYHDVMKFPSPQSTVCLRFSPNNFPDHRDDSLDSLHYWAEKILLSPSWPVMGAGGVSGELRDHSEHVDAILRSHFNVSNGRSSTFSSSASSQPSQASSSSFTFLGDALEEMACFSCSSNFTLFKRKVIA